MYMNTRGMSTVVISIIILAIASVGGLWFATNTPKVSDAMMHEETMMQKDDAMMGQKDTMMKKDDVMMQPGDTMTEQEDTMMKKDDTMMQKPEAFMTTGTVLAGTTAPLLEYTDAEYQKALAGDKLIVLFFYAEWCPTCKAEFPRMQEAFNGYTNSDVIGFRVHYNDDLTTASMKALAQEHGVAYQHTKILIKNGVRVAKSPESWQTQTYRDVFNQYK